jgi:hypothetical protein
LGKGLSRIEMKKDKEIKSAVENHRGKDDKMRALRSLYCRVGLFLNNLNHTGLRTGVKLKYRLNIGSPLYLN